MGKALDGWAEVHTDQARGALLSAQMSTFAGQLGDGPGGLTAAVSPDGATIAVGHADGRIRL